MKVAEEVGVKVGLELLYFMMGLTAGLIVAVLILYWRVHKKIGRGG